MDFGVKAVAKVAALIDDPMKEAPRQTIRRRSDEPKLKIGDTVTLKEGVGGVVLARFTPSGEKRNEVPYIVELRPDEAEKGS